MPARGPCVVRYQRPSGRCPAADRRGRARAARRVAMPAVPRREIGVCPGSDGPGHAARRGRHRRCRDGTALDQGQCSGRLTSRARALDMEPAIVVTREHPPASMAAPADEGILACVGHGRRVALAYSRSCSLLQIHHKACSHMQMEWSQPRLAARRSKVGNSSSKPRWQASLTSISLACWLILIVKI